MDQDETMHARLRGLAALPPKQLEQALLVLEGELSSAEFLMALEELRELLRDDSSGSGDHGMFVGAPVKPRPHLNSGAVALPEPE